MWTFLGSWCFGEGGGSDKLEKAVLFCQRMGLELWKVWISVC